MINLHFLINQSYWESIKSFWSLQFLINFYIIKLKLFISRYLFIKRNIVYKLVEKFAKQSDDSLCSMLQFKDSRYS